MTDEALYERMLDSMEDFFGRTAETALRLDGVLAAVTPSIPDRSVFNSVVYRDPEALLAARDELDAAYAEAGVHAWTVWTPERDAAVREGLEAAGHMLDAWPEAMAAELAGLDLERGAEGLDWERGPHLLEEMCDVLEEAFHWPAGRAARRMDWMEELYVARVDGAAAACVAWLAVNGDCAVWNVGTREAARGRGLASGLMRQALSDAREAGCQTTTLQATQLGRPVYRRLGYRELGAIQMWERRRS